MRRTLPNEDQQPEDDIDNYRPRRQHTQTGRGQESAYGDDHPEIPKVRRASLRLDTPAPQTRIPAKQTRTERLPEEDWEEEIRPVPQTRRPRIDRTGHPYREQETRLPEQTRRLRGERAERDDAEQERRSSTQTRRPRQQDNFEQERRFSTQSRRPRQQDLEDDFEQERRFSTQSRRPRQQDLEDDFEQETHLTGQTRRPRAEYIEEEIHPRAQTRYPGPLNNDKIGATRQKHPIAYEPEPADYHKPQGRTLRRQNRSQQALWTHIRDLSHNRAVVLAGGILIALIIIVPLLANLTQARLSAVIQNPGGDTNAVPGAQGSHGPGVGRDTDHPAPPVYATAAYLLDANTGATLYEHNASAHLPMMSTTKLMTGLLASQYGNLDKKITINDAIANDINQLSADSSVMGAKKGETYTLRELLYGLMLPSGNDAAIVIADSISGSMPKFVSLMNQRAQELGLHDTHYQNPHGLMDDGHYSSAHDLAVLGKVVMDVPSLHQITGTQTYHIAGSKEHAEHFFSNGDQFMYWYPGVDGGKIGWDAGANFVQVISCTRNNHHLIGVTLHTIDWWTDMRDLMNWGFHSFTWLSPREINANGHPIPYAAAWNNFARDKRENNIPLGNHGRYYVSTGYSGTDPIASFFDKNGGRAKLGFPIGQPQTVNTSQSQRFEHGTVQCDQRSKQCRLVA